MFQQLDNLNMLRFNDGMYFSDNIIHFFCGWNIHRQKSNFPTLKVSMIMIILRSFKKWKSHRYGVHWWINTFDKLKNNSYSLDELYILVTLDLIKCKNKNSILQVKNILQYFVDMKHIEVQHVKLKNIQK